MYLYPQYFLQTVPTVIRDEQNTFLGTGVHKIYINIIIITFGNMIKIVEQTNRFANFNCKGLFTTIPNKNLYYSQNHQFDIQITETCVHNK